MAEMTEPAARTGGRALIRDIAAQAGVSIATVSRVLNGHPDVSPATRDLVLQRVREVGYVGNRSARGLAGGRTGLISVVVPFTQNGFFSGIIEGASEALFERDARPVLCPTQHRHEREVSVLERLVHGTTDGTLLVTPTESRAELEHLRQLGMSLVVIDPSHVVEDLVPVVSSTNWTGGKQATEHLIALGHTAIATVTGYPGWCATEDRLAGYQTAMMAAGLPLRPEYVIESDFKLPGGLAAGQALLSLPSPPTAVVVQSDNMAVGVMRAARRRGLRLPDDLSVVGFDDVDLAAVTTPALTTVAQPLQELGRHAVTLLYRLIDKLPLEVSRVELSTKLVIRESTAPPPRGT